jgi:hypothetical protein
MAARKEKAMPAILMNQGVPSRTHGAPQARPAAVADAADGGADDPQALMVRHRSKKRPSAFLNSSRTTPKSQGMILLARADGAGDLRCDHANDGRPVSRICSAHGLTRSSI